MKLVLSLALAGLVVLCTLESSPRAASSDRCSAKAAAAATASGSQPHTDPAYGFGLTVTTDHAYPLYKVSEPINLTIKVARPAYISVIAIGTDGQISQLFPDPRQREVPLNPEKALIIPLEAESPAGCDLVKVVASSNQTAPGDTRSLTSADSRLAGSKDWQESTMMIEVVE